MNAPDGAALAALRQALAGTTGTQPAGAPPPLPLVRDDPTLATAKVIQDTYIIATKAAREDFELSDIAKARRIGKIWRDTCAALSEQYADLTNRRQARRLWLEAQIPVGPGIPADVTPADRAVLMAAWKTAYEKALNSTAPTGSGASPLLAKGRDALLAEAERFGDDVQRRAVLTACIDDSQWDVIDAWAGRHAPELGVQIKEWKYLGELLAGEHFDLKWQMGLFAHPKKPQEVFSLPGMVKAHNATVRTYNASAGRGQGAAKSIIELAPEEL